MDVKEHTGCSKNIVLFYNLRLAFLRLVIAFNRSAHRRLLLAGFFLRSNGWPVLVREEGIILDFQDRKKKNLPGQQAL